MDVLKVSSTSNPNSCAGALAGVIRHEGGAEMQVVGAGALNQAIKAIAIARGFLLSSGFDLVCTPMFADIEIGGERRTAIRLVVEDRHRRSPGAARAPTGPASRRPAELPADADAVVVLGAEGEPGGEPGGDGNGKDAEPVLADAGR